MCQMKLQRMQPGCGCDAQEKLDKRGAIMAGVIKKFITNFMTGRQVGSC